MTPFGRGPSPAAFREPVRSVIHALPAIGSPDLRSKRSREVGAGPSRSGRPPNRRTPPELAHYTDLAPGTLPAGPAVMPGFGGAREFSPRTAAEIAVSGDGGLRHAAAGFGVRVALHWDPLPGICGPRDEAKPRSSRQTSSELAHEADLAPGAPVVGLLRIASPPLVREGNLRAEPADGQVALERR